MSRLLTEAEVALIADEPMIVHTFDGYVLARTLRALYDYNRLRAIDNPCEFHGDDWAACVETEVSPTIGEYR